MGDLAGCYPGNSASTPNLNTLAKGGVVFDRHFTAAPTCSPSRAAMLTGTYPHRNGVLGLADNGYFNVRKDFSILPDYCKDAGYDTASFGTWHISGSPGKHKVDEFHRKADAKIVADSAIEYLEKRDGEKPFCLMLGLKQPHLPFTHEWPDLQRADELVLPPYLPDHPTVREEMRLFHGDLSLADHHIGRVLDHLKEKGLSEDTIIVFCSDHGIGMPLAKGTLYDPGTKIAMIVSWTGQIEGGRRHQSLSGNVDLLPTLLELIGEREQIPADLDGISLRDFLCEDKACGRDAVFTEQTWHDMYEPMRAIRTERYKLIRNFEPGRGLQIAGDVLSQTKTSFVMRDTLNNWDHPEYELYDLDADPNERNNLAGTPEMSEIEEGLKKRLEQWMEETDDPIWPSGFVAAESGYLEQYIARDRPPGGFVPPFGDRVDRISLKWRPHYIKPNECTPA